MIRSILLASLFALSLASEPRAAFRIRHTFLLTKNIDVPEAVVAELSNHSFDASDTAVNMQLQTSDTADSEAVASSNEYIIEAVVSHPEGNDALPVATTCHRADWRHMTITEELQLASISLSRVLPPMYFTPSHCLVLNVLVALLVAIEPFLFDGNSLSSICILIIVNSLHQLIVLVDSLHRLVLIRRHRSLLLRIGFRDVLSSLPRGFNLFIAAVITAKLAKLFRVYVILCFDPLDVLPSDGSVH